MSYIQEHGSCDSAIAAGNVRHIDAIQAFRKHRNVLAHDLPSHLNTLSVEDCALLVEGARKALFKLSNYRVYMEIGADPAFKDKGIDWDTIVGPEYVLFTQVCEKIAVL